MAMVNPAPALKPTRMPSPITTRALSRNAQANRRAATVPARLAIWA
jgi:hypothetical protein